MTLLDQINKDSFQNFKLRIGITSWLGHYIHNESCLTRHVLWTGDSWSNWCSKAPIRHLGQHSQPSKPNGFPRGYGKDSRNPTEEFMLPLLNSLLHRWHWRLPKHWSRLATNVNRGERQKSKEFQSRWKLFTWKLLSIDFSHFSYGSSKWALVLILDYRVHHITTVSVVFSISYKWENHHFDVGFMPCFSSSVLKQNSKT